MLRLRKKKEKKEVKVKLIVTGVTKQDSLRQLEKDCKKKGIKVVATSEPVLGVYDL